MSDRELLAQLKVGDKIKFVEEKRPYRVRARGNRYLVCTKPMNALHTVIYTVVDAELGIRGTENLVFGGGAETDEDCAEMIDRLEGAGCDFGHTEVSHRNNIPLRIEYVRAAAELGRGK